MQGPVLTRGQILLPFLDSKDVKVQAAVATVVAKLAARDGAGWTAAPADRAQRLTAAC